MSEQVKQIRLNQDNETEMILANITISQQKQIIKLRIQLIIMYALCFIQLGFLVYIRIKLS